MQARNILKKLLNEYLAATKNVLTVFTLVAALSFTFYYANAKELKNVEDPYAGAIRCDLGAFVEPYGWVWMPQDSLPKLEDILGIKLPGEYNRNGFTPLDTVIAKVNGNVLVSGETAEIHANDKLVLLHVNRIANLPMTVQLGDNSINLYLAGNAIPSVFPLTSGGLALSEPYQAWTNKIFSMLMVDGWKSNSNAKEMLASALANPAPVQVVIPAEKKVDGKIISNVLSPDEGYNPNPKEGAQGGANSQNGSPVPQNLIGMVMKLKPDAQSQFDPFEFSPRPVGVSYLLTEEDLRSVPHVSLESIRYKHIDNTEAVIAWLSKKNSMEADMQYINAVDAAGRRFNVNPLLLLAITGQEQSFVPNGTQGATEMIKNPFNVYGSWQVYAPGFTQSALIAAQTVSRLSVGCPPGMNVIHWIDSPANPSYRYAEDTDWWKGVSIFFSQLEQTQNG